MDWQNTDAERLFQACANREDSQAWDEFVRRYGLVISRTAFRTAQRWTVPTQELVDDLVQDIYLKLCAHNERALRGFRSIREGSDFGYLKVFAANTVIDQFRTRKAAAVNIPLDHAPEPAVEGPNPESEIMLREIEAGLDCVAPGETYKRERFISFLYYRHGFRRERSRRFLPSASRVMVWRACSHASPRRFVNTFHRMRV